MGKLVKLLTIKTYMRIKNTFSNIQNFKFWMCFFSKVAICKFGGERK